MDVTGIHCGVWDYMGVSGCTCDSAHPVYAVLQKKRYPHPTGHQHLVHPPQWSVEQPAGTGETQATVLTPHQDREPQCPTHTITQ